MCGILFWVNNRYQINQNLFQDSVKDIYHRGPDSSYLYFSNDNHYEKKETHLFKKSSQKYNVAIGSTRFGTYDRRSELSNMPMISNDERYVIVLNGDIYNFESLKEYLIKKNFKFQTKVDTEVLLIGFILEGINFFKKINGDFAFTIYDRKSNNVYFSRDTWGQKPLFYYKDQTDFIACSEISPIAKILKSKNKHLNINYNFINNFLKTDEWGYDEKSRLLAYDNINTVVPGSLSNLDINKFTIKSNLDLIMENRLLNCNTEFNIEEVENNLTEGIRLRLKSDQKIGLFLSGGLDSSTVVTILKRKFPETIDKIKILLQKILGMIIFI